MAVAESSAQYSREQFFVFSTSYYLHNSGVRWCKCSVKFFNSLRLGKHVNFYNLWSFLSLYRQTVSYLTKQKKNKIKLKYIYFKDWYAIGINLLPILNQLYHYLFRCSLDAARFYVCDDFQILMILLQITTIYLYKQSYSHFSSYHKPLAFAQHPWP